MDPGQGKTPPLLRTSFPVEDELLHRDRGGVCVFIRLALVTLSCLVALFLQERVWGQLSPELFVGG